MKKTLHLSNYFLDICKIVAMLWLMKTANLKNAITVSVAAKALGITRQRMYQMIEEKDLRTQKFGFKPYPILLDRDEIMNLVEKKRTKKRKE